MADEEEQLRDYIRKIIKEEQSGGGGSADLGDLGKLVRVAKDMKDAMTSDVDKALGNAVATKIVDQVIPSMGGQQQRASAGFWDSNSGVALMNKIGDQIAPLTDLVINRIGQERTNKLVDGFTNTYLGGNKGEDNALLSLDPDNPAHMHQYMALRNLSDPNVARKMLLEEKAKAMSRVSTGGNEGNTGVGSGGGMVQTIEQQNAMLRELIKARQEDRNAMVQMYNTIEKMKIEHERLKTSVSSERSFNIDAVKDRTDDGGGLEAEGTASLVNYAPKATQNEPTGENASEGEQLGVEGVEPVVEPLIKPLNEPVTAGVETGVITGEGTEKPNSESVMQSNGVLEGANGANVEKQPATVSKRKGLPQWKD